MSSCIEYLCIHVIKWQITNTTRVFSWMILFFVILLVYESRNLVFFSDAHYRMQGNIIGGVKGSIKGQASTH